MNTNAVELDLITIIQKYMENQEELDADFKQILIDNLWDLYEEEKDAINVRINSHNTR